MSRSFWGFSTRYHLLNQAGDSMDSLDKKDMAFETNLHQGSQQLENKVWATESGGSTRRYLYDYLMKPYSGTPVIAIVPYSILVIGRKPLRAVLSQLSLKNGYSKPIPQGHATTPQNDSGCSCLHDGFRCLFWHSISLNDANRKGAMNRALLFDFLLCPLSYLGMFHTLYPEPWKMIQFAGCIFFNGVGEKSPTRKEIHFWSSPLPIWFIFCYIHSVTLA